MESIGIPNAQGNAVLQSLPRRILVLHEGKWIRARRYLGEPFAYVGGVMQTGDYMGTGAEGYLLHRTPAWCAQYLQQWKPTT